MRMLAAFAWLGVRMDDALCRVFPWLKRL